MSVMKLPANYAVINEEEMVYLDGGASDLYNDFLNVGKVFNAIARIFSGASSIINNASAAPQRQRVSVHQPYLPLQACAGGHDAEYVPCGALHR